MPSNSLSLFRKEISCDGRTPAQTGCARAVPGATQGGCCFDGARNALLPIRDAAHIVHGPIDCAGTSWDNRGSRSSGETLFKVGLTTAMSELDFAMGRGVDRLAEAIDFAVARFSPPAIFIYTTCLPAMIGVDVEGVSEAASERHGLPVIAIDCAGFLGNKNYGQRIAGDALLRRVIGTREPSPTPRVPGIERVRDINLIGEWNVGGEFWSVAPLFDELGLRILCTLSGDSRYRDVQTMHRSEANLVVCSKAMLRLANQLQEKYRTPYFEGSFYGVSATSATLRGFARALNDPDLAQRTAALIAREEDRVTRELAPVRYSLRGRKALVFAGGFKSWSTVSAALDLGMTVVGTGVEKSTDEDKVRIRDLLGPKARMIEDNDQETLLRTFKDTGAEILIAGDRYIYPALKARVPFLDLDHVRDVGYAGYDGAIEFGRRIQLAIDHPVWARVGRRPPWERDAEPEAGKGAA